MNFDLTEIDAARGWHQGAAIWWTEFPKWASHASMSHYYWGFAAFTIKYISYAGNNDPYFRLKELEGPLFGVLPQSTVHPWETLKQAEPRTWHQDVYYLRMRDAFQSNLQDPDDFISPYFLLGFVYPDKTVLGDFTMNNPPVSRDPHPPSSNFLDPRVWP